MLSFNEFQATQERLSLDAACERIGVDPDAWTDEAEAILFYDGTLYIEALKDGDFYTMIERNDFKGPLEKLERTLYLEWYVSECATDYTCDQLTDLLELWCRHEDIPPASADELLIGALREEPKDRSPAQARQAVWLEWYTRTWDVTQGAELAARSGPGA